MGRAGMILAMGAVLAAVAMAQTESPASRPELKKLDLLVGTWTLGGNMKAGMRPGWVDDGK